ncbi:Ankyrin [Desulfotomaculum nigrificans CO-1-SRB]|uniref:Ankyrin n=1 Tax=Desulfotomaculum nigrificans (strain DSM 14880 / VKM B-2319 / CO-1-SRB) TaxID=868595 RepID=F6B6X0_DESCC|nr:Ankyrin [Desulfotomaculum nigrificans CO-1-SRB]
MLAKGANINAQNNIGITPLMFAAGKGHAKVVELLLAHGANVNDRDKDGRTALMHAMGMGYKNVAAILKERVRPSTCFQRWLR